MIDDDDGGDEVLSKALWVAFYVAVAIGLVGGLWLLLCWRRQRLRRRELPVFAQLISQAKTAVVQSSRKSVEEPRDIPPDREMEFAAEYKRGYHDCQSAIIITFAPIRRSCCRSTRLWRITGAAIDDDGLASLSGLVSYSGHFYWVERRDGHKALLTGRFDADLEHVIDGSWFASNGATRQYTDCVRTITLTDEETGGCGTSSDGQESSIGFRDPVDSLHPMRSTEMTVNVGKGCYCN